MERPTLRTDFQLRNLVAQKINKNPVVTLFTNDEVLNETINNKHNRGSKTAYLGHILREPKTAYYNYNTRQAICWQATDFMVPQLQEWTGVKITKGFFRLIEKGELSPEYSLIFRRSAVSHEENVAR